MNNAFGTSAYKMPAQACDSHIHIFGDQADYPLHPDRVYTPGKAGLGELHTMHRQINISRTVIVQPSPYGIDNRCTLDALAELGDDARAIAVLKPGTSDADLNSLHTAGVRGLRLNFATAGTTGSQSATKQLRETASMITGTDWHLQALVSPELALVLAEAAARCNVTLVVDHFAGMFFTSGQDRSCGTELLDVVKSGGLYVKTSPRAPLPGEPDGDAVDDFGRALIEANPDRIVWGSDWPSPGGGKRSARARLNVEAFRVVDFPQALDRLADWCPSEDIWIRLLQNTPAQLYGFKGHVGS